MVGRWLVVHKLLQELPVTTCVDHVEVVNLGLQPSGFLQLNLSCSFLQLEVPHEIGQRIEEGPLFMENLYQSGQP